jgi:hypothetical protein
MAPLRAFYDRRSEHADRHYGRIADFRCTREPSIPRGWKPTFRPPQTVLGASLPQVCYEPILPYAGCCTNVQYHERAKNL